MQDESAGQQLERIRKERGLSREELAHATSSPGNKGVTASTITKVERGEREPTDPTLRQLGDALEATFDEFPAYALAMARGLLDPDGVGLEAALAAAARIVASTPDDVRVQAREREAQALRAKAQQQRERREAERNTKPARQRRRGEGT